MRAGYADVIRAIITAEEDAVGPVAVQQVSSLPFIQATDDSWDVSSDVGPSAVHQLLEEYVAIQGAGAYGIARRAMGDLLEDDTRLELPATILPRSIREKQFVSGF